MTEAEKQFLAHMQDDRWRLSNLYRVINQHGEAVPFKMNAAQEQLFSDIHYLNVIPKARQLGFSTFIAIYMLDRALWRENTACGIVDITIDDARAKLNKMAFAYDGMPEPLKAARPIVKSNAHELVFANGSSISVGTSHRGSTLQILHISEYGKISAQFPERAREIRTGAFGTIHPGSCIFVESTAEGVGGHFHDITMAAEKLQQSGQKPTKQQFKLHFAPWHAHPGYVADPGSITIPIELETYFSDLAATHNIHLTAEQKAWYVRQRDIVGPDDMGREYPSYLEECFAHSIEGAYFKTQMSKARADRRIGRVPLDPSRPVHTSWDIGKGDATAVWFFQSHGNQLHFIHYIENSGEGVEHYAAELRDVAQARGFIYGKHFGPHDLDNSHWILPGQEAIVDVARRMGIDFTVVPRVQNKSNAIQAARNLLAMSWIDEQHCSRGIACLDAYRKLWDDKRATWKDEPFHDWASHGADAYMTAACGFTPDYVPPPVDRYARKRVNSSAWAA